MQILDVMCPYKTYHVKVTKGAWVTPEVLEQIKRKDQVWKEAKRSKDKHKIVEPKILRNKQVISNTFFTYYILELK